MLNICNIFSKLKIFRFYSLQIQILEIYAEYFSKLNSNKEASFESRRNESCKKNWIFFKSC